MMRIGAGLTALASVLGLLVLFGTKPLHAQAAGDEPITVSTEHPRLFLRPGRLRLLKRERDRTSARWQQMDLFISGKAPMPEPGFAEALYYQISGDTAVGQRAIAAALGSGGDLRQQAL